MNKIVYPFVNRRSIELGLLPRSSFLGTIFVVFLNDAWRAKSTYMLADHSPTHRSHAFRDLEEQPAAERDADRPVDQGIDDLGHQTSLHASAAKAQLVSPHRRASNCCAFSRTTTCLVLAVPGPFRVALTSRFGLARSIVRGECEIRL